MTTHDLAFNVVQQLMGCNHFTRDQVEVAVRTAAREHDVALTDAEITAAADLAEATFRELGW